MCPRGAGIWHQWLMLLWYWSLTLYGRGILGAVEVVKAGVRWRFLVLFYFLFFLCMSPVLGTYIIFPHLWPRDGYFTTENSKCLLNARRVARVVGGGGWSFELTDTLFSTVFILFSSLYRKHFAVFCSDGLTHIWYTFQLNHAKVTTARKWDLLQLKW